MCVGQVCVCWGWEGNWDREHVLCMISDITAIPGDIGTWVWLRDTTGLCPSLQGWPLLLVSLQLPPGL